MRHDRLAELLRALVEAPADLLVERLAEQLTACYGIVDTQLYQVDYRLSELLPLGGGEPRTAAGDPAWRCFDHQDPIEHDGVIYLPVSVRGERIGVLALSPVPADPRLGAELPEVATLLAHELSVAAAGTDRYLVAARSRRLTLAAEMQWGLLPGRSRVRKSFSLAGQLEPAYAVRGDTFDWVDDDQRLWLSAINGLGEGINAAMLTCLATNALRNARRAGLAVADQAALADQAIYAHHTGTQHLATLLVELDLYSGELTVVDAGSPRLLLLRAGQLIDLPLHAQFPLGMFDGTIYQPQHFQLSAGDRLFVVSDGIYDAVARVGRYGDAALERFIRRTGPMATMEAVRSLLGDLRAFVGSDLIDDAVAVCLDWYGPQP